MSLQFGSVTWIPGSYRLLMTEKMSSPMSTSASPTLGAFLSDWLRIMVSMNRLSTEKRAQIIGCLVEGNSIRATVRMTGAAKNTIVRLLADLGEACAEYQDGVL